MRFAFAGTGQVEVYARGFQLEGNIHFTTILIYTYKADMSFEILFIGIDRDIIIFTVGRYAETGTGHNVFGVFGSEGRAMVTPAVRQLDNFGCTERFQVNTGQPGCIIPVYKDPFSIGFTAGLRHFHMVKIIPWNETV
ncbi:hypothetical protein D9M68_534510 [compost metagenome]